MAFYSQTIFVERDTPEDNPKVVRIDLNERWITDIWVGFEDGCAWMVKVRIFYGIRRWFPENPDGWIIGNDIWIPIRQIVPLPAKREFIDVYCCSPGTKYDHNIHLYVWTSEEPPVPLESGLTKLLKGLGIE
ncbi:MAG: hypothetical protein ABIM54_00835 [candidate division WOR-3 bacterium]